MGMTIDDEIYVHGYLDEIRQDKVIIRNEGGYFGTVADELVEVIPKDQYKARLKADLEAILVELQLEIEEIPNSYEHKPIGTYDYCLGAEHERKVNLEIIQQKINSLKENTDVRN